MKLKNVLIVTGDIHRARQFYHDLFGLELLPRAVFQGGGHRRICGEAGTPM